MNRTDSNSLSGKSTSSKFLVSAKQNFFAEALKREKNLVLESIKRNAKFSQNPAVRAVHLDEQAINTLSNHSAYHINGGNTIKPKSQFLSKTRQDILSELEVLDAEINKKESEIKSNMKNCNENNMNLPDVASMSMRLSENSRVSGSAFMWKTSSSGLSSTQSDFSWPENYDFKPNARQNQYGMMTKLCDTPHGNAHINPDAVKKNRTMRRAV